VITCFCWSDTVAKMWTSVRARPGPGALHSHAACKLPSSMLLFGGERDGQPTNELWRFHFGMWEPGDVACCFCLAFCS
jgi:hypothetical protein